MPTGINLTPPQEIRRRRTQYVVGTSTKIAALMLLVVASTALYYFLKLSDLKNQIADLEKQKTELVDKRNSMKEVEDYAKKLSGKYFLLQKYLEGRLRYSSVILELLSRVPDGVLFDDLGFDGVGKRTKISGTSKDAVSVAAFVTRLAKEGNSSSESAVTLGSNNAFLDVRLDSLNVDEGKEILYSITFRINEEAFLK